MKDSVVITGGLGFIGFNAALRYAAQGRAVTLVDDLSRATARRNLIELKRLAPRGVEFVAGDVRQPRVLDSLFKRRKGASLVLHLAAQVAVTTSVARPREDFEINALGSFNVLEAARRHAPDAVIIYASTNKVYGGTEWVKLGSDKTRYYFRHPENGIDESAPLDFHSPYGCSKGAADQYVRDYSRIYGLRTVVMRQSCIYGPWQYGDADQGWIAWFIIAALSRQPLTIYGDGRQVRDVLYVDDLIDLYEAAERRAEASAGEVFNVGGGAQRTLSLLELLDWMNRRLQANVSPRWEGWRPGDQRVYVSDISKAGRALGWKPRVTVGAGLEKLFAWLSPRFT